MSISPAFTFGLLLATLYGAVAHLIAGGDGRRLVGLIAAAWVGFAIGQGAGQILSIRLFAVGPLNLFSATLGAAIGCLTAAVLSARRGAGRS